MTKKRQFKSWPFVKRYTSDQGMTLVEVLLAITILAILAVLMGGVFVNAIGTISRAGDLDATGNTAAKVTENILAKQTLTQDGADIKINEEVDLVKGTTVTTTPDVTLEINFPDIAKTIYINGDQKIIKSTGSRNDVPIEVFIPK